MCVRKQVESVQALADAFRKTIDALAKEGKLSLLIHGMLEHQGHEHVQAAACEALAGLTASDDNQRVKVAAEGGIGAIVKALQHHPTHAKIQEAACGALLNLTVNSANKAKAKSAGAEDAVKRAMALQDATAKTKEWGQKVLDRLKNV
jgi:hypothetical protein